jgi:hypothetical protein
LLEEALASDIGEHGELLSTLVARRGEPYASMARFPASRAWFGEKASNSLHHTGLLEPE